MTLLIKGFNDSVLLCILLLKYFLIFSVELHLTSGETGYLPMTPGVDISGQVKTGGYVYPSICMLFKKATLHFLVHCVGFVAVTLSLEFNPHYV